MTKQYNAISLFLGAMGLDLGLERAGLAVRTCVELNKLACRTIRANTAIPVPSRVLYDGQQIDNCKIFKSFLVNL
jgi:site-specific DNA-cytosine methylase